YAPPNGAAGSTPEFALQSAATVPVLPLSEHTHYTFTAVGALPDGGSITSAPDTLTTGSVPSAVHRLSVLYDGGAIEPGYTLVARLPQVATSGVDYLTIVDSTGTPVWYLGVAPGLVGDFQKQPDGTYTVAQDDVAHAVPGLPEAVAQFVQ